MTAATSAAHKEPLQAQTKLVPAFDESWLTCVLMIDSLGAVDQNATVSSICRLSGWQAKETLDWMSTIEKWAGNTSIDRTLFNLARYIKGKAVSKHFAEAPSNHKSTFWMCIYAANLLYLQSDFQSTFSPEFDGMVEVESMMCDDTLELLWEERWRQVRFGEGENLVLTCAKLAKEDEKDGAGFHDNPKLSLFLAFCSQLKDRQGDAPIFLPQEKIAEALGEQQQTISAMIQKATREKWLVKVSPHSYTRGQAAGYTFHDRRPKTTKRTR